MEEQEAQVELRREIPNTEAVGCRWTAEADLEGEIQQADEYKEMYSAS